MTEAPRIRIVGIGDDGVAGISPRAAEVIEGAVTLYGGARHLAMFPNHPARRVDLSVDFSAVEELVTGACGEDAVVLASGDPMLFGIGATLARRLGTEAARRLEVIAHPSSVHLAFAAIGESWHGAAVLSAHGRPLAPVLVAAMPEARFAVLLSPENTAAVVARALLDAGMEDATAAVCEHLGGVAERVTRGTLSSIVGGAFSDLSVLVVLRAEHEVTHYWRSAIPASEFAHRNGMITKPEVRALAIAALRLSPNDTMWDIGAGSGSVAIEAALSLPQGQVFAVECDVSQIAHIEENRRRFRTPQVEIVRGEAPGVLGSLPDPDAVFIGGGGEALAGIVRASCARLAAGGRLAVTLVTLEHLAPLLASLPSTWYHAISQITIAHGAPLADGTRLVPDNPVFLVTAQAPAQTEVRS